MSDIARLIADLAAAGIPPELLGRVAATIAELQIPTVLKDAAAEKRRAWDRERKQAAKVRNSTGISTTLSTGIPQDIPPENLRNSTGMGAPLAGGRDNLLFLEIESQEKKVGSKEVRETSPRDVLLTVLDEETADAVIKHRKAKRAPLSTLLAARGLVKAFYEFPDGPKAAAEMMVINGWTGFKREYWERQARGSPNQSANAKPTFEDLARFYDAQAERESAGGEGVSPLLQDFSKQPHH